MNPEVLLSGIREMISAGIRQAIATNPEEHDIAGQLYTVNEGVVLKQLTDIQDSFYGLAMAIKNHGHDSFNPNA